MTSFQNKRSKLTCIAMCVGFVVLSARSADALDGYQDRSGLFGGFGVGGGGAFQGKEVGGAILGDLQLGGGLNQNITLAMDVDFWFQLMDNYRNFLITPGPEFNYFFGDTGLFLRAGIGLPLITVTADKDDSREFTIGFNGSAGMGWEFFVNSNWAIGLAIEGDYNVTEYEHIISVGFSMGLKYY